jgi:hypothetical protein
MLTSGRIFIKHGRTGFPHERTIKLAQDHQTITWEEPLTSPKKFGSMKAAGGLKGSMLLSSVQDIVEGHETETFKRSGVTGTQSCCFSLIGEDRTLDLQATTVEVKNEWVVRHY